MDILAKQKKLIDFLLQNSKTKKFAIDVVSYKYPIKELTLDRFNHVLNWEKLSFNSSIQWSLNLVDKYKEQWEWSGISHLVEREWGLKLLSKYPNKIDWCMVSQSEAISWDEKLISEYKDYWHWGDFGLSNNENLPWSCELIEKYEDKWEWGEIGLSCNSSLPWSIDFLDKYIEKWDWKDLSNNKGLPWSDELVDRYSTKWDSDSYGYFSYLPEYIKSKLFIFQDERMEKAWRASYGDEEISEIEKQENKKEVSKTNISITINFESLIDFINKYESSIDLNSLSFSSDIYEDLFSEVIDDSVVNEILGNKTIQL
jgi:hypothetical protein